MPLARRRPTGKTRISPHHAPPEGSATLTATLPPPLHAPPLQKLPLHELAATPAEALMTAQQAVAAAHDADDMLQAIVLSAMSLSPLIDGASIELIEGSALVYRATIGVARARQGQTLPMIGTLSGYCVAQRRPCVTGNAQDDARTIASRARDIGVVSMLVVPVFRNDAPAKAC